MATPQEKAAATRAKNARMPKLTTVRIGNAHAQSEIHISNVSALTIELKFSNGYSRKINLGVGYGLDNVAGNLETAADMLNIEHKKECK